MTKDGVLRSVIILFQDTDSVSSLREMQLRVAKKYGGSSALQLPLHMTLVRWRDNSDTITEMLGRFHRRPVAARVTLGKIRLVQRAHSVWYSVFPSRAIRNLRSEIRTQLERMSIPSESVIAHQAYHITIAYKDFSENVLAEIAELVTREQKSTGRELLSTHAVICEQDANGKWGIAD